MELDVNYILLAMVTGAILLACVYHSVLFMHNRIRLIGYYTVYLWSVFAYCFMKCIYFVRAPSTTFFELNEVLLMATFVLYIRFTRVAMELDPVTDKYAYRFCKIATPVVIVYVIAHAAARYLYFSHITGGLPYLITYITVRAFLLTVGFMCLVIVMRKRKNIYFRYIFYAILTIIVSGFLATVTQLSASLSTVLDSLSVLVVGYNVDVFFFSAAISYKMRVETVDKEKANRRVLEQELEIQKNNMERMRLSFKIKEEERSRIATELHDEIGSTLSSISILSDVITKEQNITSLRSMQLEIKSNSKTIMEKMDDIIWSLNPRNDSMEKMLVRIRQFASPLFEAKNIDYNFQYDTAVYDIPLPIEKRQQAYLIIKESINNMVKHAACTTATVAAKTIDGKLIFSITDNGKGFDTDTEFPGNGLMNMKNRAKNMGADIVFSSVPAVETSITLTVNIV